MGKIRLEKKKIKTVFDEIENSKPISVPTWNEDPIHEKIRKKLVLSVGNENRMKNLEKLLHKDFNKKKFLLTKNIRKDYDLLFCYFITLDIIGHMYRENVEKMRKYYKLFEDLVKNIKKIFRGKIIIISDHGMKRIGKYGYHSKYMFFSSNFKVNRIRSIKEIKEIIVKNCM